MSLQKQTAQALQANRHFLTAPSKVPGRLRLKCATKAIKHLDKNLLSNLKEALESINGIQAVRVNVAALSVVVEYDKSIIAPSVWTDFLDGSDEQATRALCRLFGESALAAE